MAELTRTVTTIKSTSKITKRELLLNELAELLAENYDQDVKVTKEGLVLALDNEKGETKDFVFRIVEKKDRIKKESFL